MSHVDNVEFEEHVSEEDVREILEFANNQAWFASNERAKKFAENVIRLVFAYESACKVISEHDTNLSDAVDLIEVLDLDEFSEKMQEVKEAIERIKNG